MECNIKSGNVMSIVHNDDETSGSRLDHVEAVIVDQPLAIHLLPDKQQPEKKNIIIAKISLLLMFPIFKTKFSIFYE